MRGRTLADAGFVLFGGPHLCALATIALLAAGLTILLRRTSDAPRGGAVRRAVCWTLGVILIGNAAFAEAYWIATGTWSVRYSLPLHLCDMTIFIAAAALFAAGAGRLSPDGAGRVPPGGAGRRAGGPWQTCYELAYFWGLAGTTQALLTPELDRTFPHPEFVKFFVGHGATVAGVLSLTLGLRLRPRPGSVLRTWLITNALVPPVLAFNGLTGSNYMFLCGPASRPSLLDWFPRFPLNILVFEILALVVMTVCYAPFGVSDAWRRRRGAAARDGAAAQGSPLTLPSPRRGEGLGKDL